MKFHDTLNEKIWDLTTEDLIPEVKEKLKEIAEAFIEFLEIPTDAVLDKVITGSSASYNYNEFSDLDLHIIVDYDKVHEDCPLVNGYLNSLKKQFNDNHDIFIHGVPVELYAEQKDQGTVHNGLYSLQTGWIDKPQKIEPTDNDAAVEAKFNEIKELVDKCEDSEEAQELIDKIYTMRKAGLAEAGEFCTENLAFKKLRNEGCMDKLRQLKKEQIDKQLSLESYNEEEKTFEDYFYSFNHIYTLDSWFLIHCFDGYKPKEYKSIEISHPESNNGIIIQNKGEKRTKDKGNFFYLLDLEGKAKNIDSPEITATIYQEKVWIPDNITNEGIGGALKTFCKDWSNTNRYANGHTEYYIELFDLTLDKNCKESKAIEQFLKQFENLLQNIDDRVTWEKANSNTVDKNESIKEDNTDDIVNNLIDKYGKEKLQKGLQTPYQKDYIWGLLHREKGLDLTAILDCLKSKLNESIKEGIDMEAKLSDYLTQNGFTEKMGGDNLILTKTSRDKTIDVLFWNQDIITVEYKENNTRIGARKLDISDDLKLQKAINVILIDPNTKKPFIESIKEDYEEDDCEDCPEEMHTERYAIYFETQEGRQKYTMYHVYTDSTDDSYNELCDKRDNQLGMYNSYKELKDALKERAEKIAAKQGWTVKSIENLGEDDEYYRERNKWESIHKLNRTINKAIGEDMEKEPVYHYSVEDIDKQGNDFDNAEEAYEQAQKDLTALGYEVKELNDDGEFEIVSTSTGVAHTGVIYPSNPELDESLQWEICKDMEKGYFYICNDEEIYCDQDGEPYHFNTREEAEEFLHTLNEDATTLEKKMDVAQDTLNDLLKSITNVKEDFDLDKAYNLINEALKED